MPVLNQKPQVNLAQSTVLRMWLVFGCALGTVLYSALSDNFSSLALAIFALAAGLSAEALALHFGKLQTNQNGNKTPGGSLSDGSAAASIMILVLLLPHSVNPVYAALGAVFAMLLVKYSYGGLGANWVNPALGAWLFIRVSWPSLFSGAPVPSGGGLDIPLRTFLNGTIFSLTGAELPPGYAELLLGQGTGGIVADRGLPVLILGTILLTAAQVNRAWIPGLYLAVYGLLVRAFGAFPGGGGLGEGDMLYCLCSGGTLAAAFLLISDPVTGAKTPVGMFCATTLAAVLAFLFRYPGGELYGAFPAAAMTNALVPLIRAAERYASRDKR
ncbi:MAG: RnfABCDGE type electron transport complex subunit D [Treponema sp.]|jgi:electron transport complex protein RnfD|nr:RnfABCDGE type electron transport complex subunit D [Treponema sp.]